MIYNNNYVDVTDNILKISPKKWLHQCTVINSRTGKITVVVNGKVLQDSVIEYFADADTRPRNLTSNNYFKKNVYLI